MASATRHEGHGFYCEVPTQGLLQHHVPAISANRRKPKKSGLDDILGVQMITACTKPGTLPHRAPTVKIPVGEMARESVYIKHIVADEDGSLNIKPGGEFIDSKAYLDAIQALIFHSSDCPMKATDHKNGGTPPIALYAAVCCWILASHAPAGMVIGD